MHFEHLEEPTRAARIESSNADLVVHFIDSQGKSRKKTFKGKGESTAALASTWLQALRFVVREGFGFGRSDTNPRWLFFQDEPYMGQQPFAYDAASGRVCLTEAQPRVLKWLDAHANTVENIDLAVPSIRGIVARDGVLWLLLAVSGGAEPWQRPVEGGWGGEHRSSGRNWAYALRRSIG